MSQNTLWNRFEHLTVSEDAATSAAIAIGSSETHLLIKGQSGEPVFLLRAEKRKTPRAPVRLKHVAVMFDVPFEVKLTDQATPVVSQYAKFTCSPQSTALHRWFIEFVSAVTQRFARPLESHEMDEILESMLELFRHAVPPSATTVTGLWGELFAIYLAADRRALVRAWHSQPMEVFDFSFPNARLEVKTTEGRRREHEFSLLQVNSSRDGDHVLSIIVQRSTSGVNVIDLAETVSDALDEASRERLWRIVMETLGVELDGVDEQRFDLEAARASVRAFHADQIPAPAVPAEWQSVVTKVRFSACLNALGDGIPVPQMLARL